MIFLLNKWIDQRTYSETISKNFQNIYKKKNNIIIFL